MVYYPILAGEIAKRGVKKKTIAQSIGVCDKSLSNKMSGRVPFSLQEAMTINKTFFPDIEIDELFKRADV